MPAWKVACRLGQCCLERRITDQPTTERSLTESGSLDGRMSNALG
jgi:hypothetical protein